MKFQKISTTILFILLVTIVGCSNLTADPELEGLSVQLDDYWEYNPEIIVMGKVVLSDEINLSFPMPGHVSNLLVKEGDYVKEGDLIASLNSTALESELRNAEASLVIAKANLDRVLAGSHHSEIYEAESIVESIQFRNLSDSYNQDQKGADLEAAQARLDYLEALPLPEDVAIAEAEVAQTKAAVDAITANIGLTELIAPRVGTITMVLINEYEFARIGEPIVTIGDISNVSVEVEMDGYEIQEIFLGGKALIWFYGLSEEPVSGTIIKILPNDRISGEDFIVRVNLDEVPENLRWGMSAEVRFPSK